MALYCFHHGYEGVVDVGLPVCLLGEYGPRPVCDRFTVGDAHHVERPQAEHQGYIILFSKIQNTGEILYGVCSRPGYHVAAPYRCIGTGCMQPEPHGIATVGPHRLKGKLKLRQVCCARTQIACKIHPGHIRSAEPEFLTVEADPVGCLCEHPRYG